MKIIKIGMTLTQPVETGAGTHMRVGEVIYINREHRYFMMRFKCPMGRSYTSSYKIYGETMLPD